MWKKNSKNMKTTFPCSDSVLLMGLSPSSSVPYVASWSRPHNEGHIRTFCAAAVLAPREDRHVSSPSDCLRRYHPFPRIGSCLSLPCNFAVSSPPVVGWSHSLALSRELCGWAEIRTLLASSRPLSLSALCEPLIHTLATRLQPILTDIGCLY